MEKKMSKKALEIANEIEKQYGDDRKINIYYGTPNAKYKKCWWAIAPCLGGFHIPGTYGMPLRKSNTLSGLIKEGKYDECFGISAF